MSKVVFRIDVPDDTDSRKEVEVKIDTDSMTYLQRSILNSVIDCVKVSPVDDSDEDGVITVRAKSSTTNICRVVAYLQAVTYTLDADMMDVMAYPVKPVARLLSTVSQDDLSLLDIAARNCYSPKSPVELITCQDTTDTYSVVEKCVSSGHTSVLEHMKFTFTANMSRAASHQLVRHRIASFSQKSQRYVDLKDRVPVIVPSTVAVQGIDAVADYLLSVSVILSEGRKLIARNVPKEDARYLYPSCLTSDVVITMNVSALAHFFNVRRCVRAQWEIRSIADQMHSQLVDTGLPIFKSEKYMGKSSLYLFGPNCRRYGYCHESKSCGRAPHADVVMPLIHEHFYS